MMDGKTPKGRFPLHTTYDTLARWDSDFTLRGLLLDTTHTNTHTHVSSSLSWILFKTRMQEKNTKTLEHVVQCH